MTERAFSRRKLLEAAPCSLVVAVGLPQLGGERADGVLNPNGSETIRKYYAAWEQRDWHPLDILLADDFTFTSENDDHIDKRTFKTRRWEPQIDLIERFELKRMITDGNDAFVMYACRTKSGKTIRNVEYFRLRGGKVQAIERYFGAQAGFAPAVSGGPK